MTKSQRRNLDRLTEVGGTFIQTSKGFRLSTSHKGFHTTALIGLKRRGLVTYERNTINGLEDWVDTYTLVG